MMGNLTLDQIEEVLRTEVIGRIACVADGWPYIVPITYVYDGGEFVFSHSAEGRKIEAMRQNPQVLRGRTDQEHRELAHRDRPRPLRTALARRRRAGDGFPGREVRVVRSRSDADRPAEKMFTAARESFVRSSSRSGSSSEQAALSSPEYGPVRMLAPSLSPDVPEGAEIARRDGVRPALGLEPRRGSDLGAHRPRSLAQQRKPVAGHPYRLPRPPARPVAHPRVPRAGRARPRRSRRGTETAVVVSDRTRRIATRFRGLLQPRIRALRSLASLLGRTGQRRGRLPQGRARSRRADDRRRTPVPARVLPSGDRRSRSAAGVLSFQRYPLPAGRSRARRPWRMGARSPSEARPACLAARLGRSPGRTSPSIFWTRTTRRTCQPTAASRRSSTAAAPRRESSRRWRSGLAAGGFSARWACPPRSAT